MYARKWSIRARRIRVVAIAICLVAVPLTLSSAPLQREYSRTTPDKLDELAANVLNVSPTTQGTFAVSDAKLMVPAGAVASAVRIKITPLLPEEVVRLDQGMNNVTRGSGGYRFTPDGMTFTTPVTLELPYDPTRIPGGQNPDDIYTFYYDVAAESWKAVPRVRVDKARKTIVSQTDHFTDFINATITVPDHPTPASLNPTSMKDIKVASPDAEINLIHPPQVNHQGTASLQYPIEIPPGRNRLQPEVAFAYNSGGGNGWVGLGWDLSMQSVSIDTRWGVPRYDTGQIEAGVPKETEMVVDQISVPLCWILARTPSAVR